MGIQERIKNSEYTIRSLLENHCKYINNIKLVTDNQYSSYDAYNDKYLLEFKTRYKRYPSTQIEKIKLDKNIIKANESGREFLYVVRDPSGLYVFNISKLSKEGYQFKWITMRCPKTTSFKNREYIDKIVHNIPFSKCHWKYI